MIEKRLVKPNGSAKRSGMRTVTLIFTALFAASCGENSGSAANAEPEDPGRVAFRECATCHVVQEGEASRLGPNLFGVYGRAAGTLDDFSYSKAMQNSGIIWDDETLNAFIENPQKFLRGNRMSYPGQPDAEKRAVIIAYLKSLEPSDD
jgi:cytochrome c